MAGFFKIFPRSFLVPCGGMTVIGVNTLSILNLGAGVYSERGREEVGLKVSQKQPKRRRL